MIKRITFNVMVISDTENGTKFASTIARPEMELTAAWLGTRKKNTATAITKVAKVMLAVSQIIFLIFIANHSL